MKKSKNRNRSPQRRIRKNQNLQLDMEEQNIKKGRAKKNETQIKTEGKIKKKVAPPLSVWLMTALLLIAFGLISVFSVGEMPELQTTDIDVKTVSKRIEKYAQTRKFKTYRKQKMVVIIGSSLVNVSFGDEKYLNMLAKSMGLGEITFFKIVQYGLEHTSNLFPIMEKIPQAKPDLIILEDQILTWQNFKRETPGFFKNHRSQLLTLFKKVFDPQSRQSVFADPMLANNLKWNDIHTNSGRWSTKKRIEMRKMMQSKQALFEHGMRLKKWQECPVTNHPSIEKLIDKQKNKLALLTIPVSKSGSSVTPMRIKSCQIKKNAQLKKYNVPLFHVNYQPPKNEYIDFTHFNSRGRIKFEKQIMTQIGDYLKKRFR